MAQTRLPPYYKFTIPFSVIVEDWYVTGGRLLNRYPGDSMLEESGMTLLVLTSEVFAKLLTKKIM